MTRSGIFSSWRWYTGMLALAGSYAAAGAACFHLMPTPAGPPLMFAAAGVGVVGLIHLGAGAWPAVFLAMLLVHPALDWTWMGLLAAAVAGAGAAGGALAGRALALRFVDPQLPLAHERSVAGFLLVAAPLAGVPGAVAAGMGAALAEGWAAPAVTGALLGWWLAETLGIAIAGSLLLVLLAPGERWLHPRRVTVALTLGLCLGAAWAVGHLVHEHERVQRREEFGEWARPVSSQLEYTLRTNAHLMVNTALWLGDIDPDELADRFPGIAGHAYQQGDALAAIAWMPWVRHEDRDAFERTLSEHRGKPSTIREYHDDRLQPSRPRPVYAPLLTMLPEDRVLRSPAIGFDVLSEPVRRAAAQRAIRTGQLTATAEPVHIHSDRRELSTLLFVPIFEPGVELHDGPLEQAPLRGLLVSAMDLDALTATAIATAQQPRTMLRIVDVTDAASPVQLIDAGHKAQSTGTTAGEHATEARVSGGEAAIRPWMLHEHEVAFASRRWMLQLGQASAVPASIGWMTAAALWAALLFTALLLAMVLLISGRTLAYQRLAWQRYRELESASATVDEQVRDRLLAEAMLADTERRFEALAMASPVGIYHAQSDGQCVFFNRKWAQMTGRPAEQSLGNGWMQFVHEEDRPRMVAQWRAAVAEGCRFHEYYRLVRHDGRVFEVLEQGAPVRDAVGRLIGYVGTVTDITELKDTERALRDAEERYRMATEAGETAVWSADLRQDRVATDGSIERMFGIKPMGSQPRSAWLQRVHPEDRQEVEALWHRCVSGECSRYDLECRVMHHDGRLRWVDVQGTVIRDGGGTPVMMTGIARDITERKRQEQALRSSEQRYRTLLDNLPDYIARFDRSMRQTYISAGPLEPLLRASGGLSGSTLGELGLEAGKAAEVELAIREVFDTGRPASLMLDLSVGGQARHFEFRLLPEHDGEQTVDSVLAIGRDITERRLAQTALEQAKAQLEQRVAERTEELAGANQRLIDANRDLVQEIIHRGEAERELRQSRRLIENILNADPTHVFTADFSARCAVFVNPRLAEFLGVDADSPGQITADTVRGRIHEEDLARLEAHIEAVMALEDGAVSNCEFRMTNADGNHRWMHLNTTVFSRDRDGRPRQVLGAAVDVTDRKTAEYSARRAERLAAIGTLAAGIAHEINNPLGTIMIAAHEVRSAIEQPDAAEHVRQMAEQIMQSTERCADIVRRVLRFTRPSQAARYRHDLATVVRNAIDITHRFIENQGARIELEVDDHLPQASIFAAEIEQVMVNMIQNALHARADRIHVQLGRDGSDRLAVRVRDNGRGMSPEDAARAFDPFYTTRLHEGGTGLGLSICHGIVADHGGQIRILDTGPEGTTMAFDLPIAGDEADEDET